MLNIQNKKAQLSLGKDVLQLAYKGFPKD